MAVDTATTIAGFDATKPTGAEAAAELDDNIRHVKGVVKSNLPNIGGTVTASHTELSYVTGVTSAIQTQLDSKGAKAGQTWTGTHDFTGATVTVPAATSGSQPYTKTQVDALVISATAPSWTITSTAVSKTLVAFEACEVTASGQTLTFPSSPTAGVTRVAVLFRNGITGTFDPGSNKINESSGTMTCNQPGLGFQFLYVSSTKGWTPSRI